MYIGVDLGEREGSISPPMGGEMGPDTRQSKLPTLLLGVLAGGAPPGDSLVLLVDFNAHMGTFRWWKSGTVLGCRRTNGLQVLDNNMNVMQMSCL